ncbi:hypothetical protein Q3G72_018557 [Acer saccharum]|nr:hypothetical protein Q3G72_018557 [Acer saccharum]
MIISGKDKGESGTIKRVILSQNRVIVEGKNLVKKNISREEKVMKVGSLLLKPQFTHQMFKLLTQLQGTIVLLIKVNNHGNVSICLSIEMIIEYYSCRTPCKVGTRYLEDGTKTYVAGAKDTPMDLVMEKTYDAKTGKGMPEL